MRFELEVRFNWIRECEQHGGRLNRWMEVLRTGPNIEMSRLSGAKVAVPERDGTAYILIQKCSPRATST